MKLLLFLKLTLSASLTLLHALVYTTVTYESFPSFCNNIIKMISIFKNIHRPVIPCGLILRPLPVHHGVSLPGTGPSYSSTSSLTFSPALSRFFLPLPLCGQRGLASPALPSSCVSGHVLPCLLWPPVLNPPYPSSLLFPLQH